MTRLEALLKVRALVAQYGSGLYRLPREHYREVGALLAMTGFSAMSCNFEVIDREIERARSDVSLGQGELS